MEMPVYILNSYQIINITNMYIINQITSIVVISISISIKYEHKKIIMSVSININISNVMLSITYPAGCRFGSGLINVFWAQTESPKCTDGWTLLCSE